jgi:hypothetical protein
MSAEMHLPDSKPSLAMIFPWFSHQHRDMESKHSSPSSLPPGTPNSCIKLSWHGVVHVRLHTHAKYQDAVRYLNLSSVYIYMYIYIVVRVYVCVRVRV